MGNIKMDEIPVLKVTADGKLFRKETSLLRYSITVLQRYCPEQGIGFHNWDIIHLNNKTCS